MRRTIKAMNKKKPRSPPTTTTDLLKRGNIGLLRLLIAVNVAGPEGVATNKLLHQLGSTHHAKAFIARAELEGLIERKVGEAPALGQFRPKYNTITDKGKQLLQSQLI
jgi:hypothetical protein